jgi:hypothetical protein
MIPPQPDVTGELPPPEKLKNKVLLKVTHVCRGPVNRSQGKMVNFRDDEDEDEEEKKENQKVREQLKTKKGEKTKKEEVNEEEDEVAKEMKRGSGGKIALELSELIHLKAVHFKNFEDSKGEGNI